MPLWPFSSVSAGHSASQRALSAVHNRDNGMLRKPHRSWHCSALKLLVKAYAAWIVQLTTLAVVPTSSASEPKRSSNSHSAVVEETSRDDPGSRLLELSDLRRGHQLQAGRGFRSRPERYRESQTLALKLHLFLNIYRYLLCAPFRK